MTTFDVDRWSCPEAIQHGPPDRAGHCPWCRHRVTLPSPHRTDRVWPQWQQDQEDAYRRFYDPDWGILPADTDPRGSAGWAGEL